MSLKADRTHVASMVNLAAIRQVMSPHPPSFVRWCLERVSFVRW